MLLSHSKDALTQLSASLPAWSSDARRAALELVETSGLPTKFQEDWRYSDPSTVYEQTFLPLTTKPTAVAKPSLTDCHQIVLIDGALQENAGEPLPPGITLTTTDDKRLAAPPKDGDLSSLHTLNRALYAGGVRVSIAAGTVLEQPIEIIQVISEHGGESAVHSRICVDAGTNSQCAIILTTQSNTAVRFINTSVQLNLAKNAHLEWFAVEQLSPNSHHYLAFCAELQRDSQLHSHTLDEGCAFNRHDVAIHLLDTNAEVSLNGTVIAQNDTHTDHHTTIHHRHEHCTSNQLFKGILSDKAVKVFNGKVIVYKDAQQTSSSQYNYNLLLDIGAVVNTKPELEIYADDVKCAHGATVGQLDQTLINYMRCRGIAAEEAEQMLSVAFILETAEKIKNPVLRQFAEARISHVLTQQSQRRAQQR